MRNWNRYFLLLAVAFALAACGGRPAKLELGVDLYLHPDSAAPADVLLQTAIQDRINSNDSLRRDTIHVRVYELNVFLSGAVKDACTSGKIAEQIAGSTTVAVNSGSGGAAEIRGKRIENHIKGMDDQTCQG